MATRERKKSKKALALEALEANGGNISNAAKAIGVARSTLYRWINDDEKMAQAVKDIDESYVDDLETTARDIALKKKNPKMVMFLLARKGRDRGYGDQQTIETINNTNAPAITDEEIYERLKEYAGDDKDDDPDPDGELKN